jgi:hypothetical protein
MAKSVTKAVDSVLASTFGMDKQRRYVACDDGTTYVFEREIGSPRWRAYMRISSAGEMSAEPSRLPSAVAAHMDGRTWRATENGDKQYWVK